MSILLIQAAGFGFLILAFVVLLFVIFLVASAVRIVQEYERGVIFRLGRVQGTAKGPGLSPHPDTGQDDKDRPEDRALGPELSAVSYPAGLGRQNNIYWM